MRHIEQSSTTALPLEFAVVALDEKDPNAGGASHLYAVRHPEHGEVAKIQFQHGPRNAPGSVSGTFDGQLLDIVADRLECFQAGPFAADDNVEALRHIHIAAALLNQRAVKRQVRGVLGLNVK